MGKDAVTFYGLLKADLVLAGLILGFGSLVSYSMYNVSNCVRFFLQFSYGGFSVINTVPCMLVTTFRLKSSKNNLFSSLGTFQQSN